MRWLRSDKGFTLLEVVIVMAITALALVAVLAGRGQLNQNAAFTSALEDAKNTFRSIQNQAYNTISPNPNANVGKSTYAVFGNVAEMTANKSVVTTYTLVADNATNPTELYECNVQKYTLDDGLEYKPTGTDPHTQAIIFSRGTQSLYVSPNDPIGQPVAGSGINETPLGGSLCAGNLDANPAVGLGTCFGLIRTQANPAGTGCGAAPPPPPPPPPTPPTPDLTITSPGLTTLDSATGPYTVTSTTNNFYTLQISVPGACSPAGNIITLTTNAPAGGAPSTSNPALTTSAPVGGFCTYTTTYNNLSPGSYTATAIQTVGGVSSAPPGSNLLTFIYAPPPPPTGLCSAAGYVCGLEGQYYAGSHMQNLETVVVDTQVGTNLGNGQSSYNNFLPTLRIRTGLPIVDFASVKWTGQILLTPSKVVCFDSNQGATMTIDDPVARSVTDTGGGGPACETVDVGGPAAPSWFNITITYSVVWGGLEGPTYARLLFKTGAAISEVPAADLRTPPPALRGPPPNIQGLTGQYFLGATPPGPGNPFQTPTGLPRVDHVIGPPISAGTPGTTASSSPTWSSSLGAKTGNTFGIVANAVDWTGYMFTPVSGYYFFCLNFTSGASMKINDDGYGGNPGTILNYPKGLSGVGYDYPAETLCISNPIAMAQGFHSVELQSVDDYPSTIGFGQFKVEYEQVAGPASPPVVASLKSVPANWWSTNTYLNGLSLTTQPTNNLSKIIAKLQHPAPVARFGVQSSSALQLALTKSIMALVHTVAKWIFPPLHAAAAPVYCDTNILNPANYTTACSGTFGTNASIPVDLKGDPTKTAHLNFTASDGTINWTIN